MALGALQARAEKKLGRRFGARHRVAARPQETCRRIEIGAAARGDQLANKLVKRFIFGDALANPSLKSLNSFSVEDLFFVAQQVGPFQRPEVGEFGALQQLVDQARALL